MSPIEMEPWKPAHRSWARWHHEGLMWAQKFRRGIGDALPQNKRRKPLSSDHQTGTK